MKKKIAITSLVLVTLALLFIAGWQYLHPPVVHFGMKPNMPTTLWWATIWLPLLAAVMVFLLRHWLIRKLARLFLVVSVVLALMLEPLLHWWGIPHPEGLWLPALEGGAVVSAIATYWQRVKAGIEHWIERISVRARRK